MPPDLKAAIGKWMSLGLDPDLVAAFCLQESAFDSNAMRYEQFWRYFLTPEVFAANLHVTPLTEKTLQAFSYGPMQIMGAVARELGYLGPLPNLLTPDNGVHYGCLKLLHLTTKFANVEDAISSYNQGNPAANLDGSYKNQAYVDSVMGYYKRKLYTVG